MGKKSRKKPTRSTASLAPPYPSIGLEQRDLLTELIEESFLQKDHEKEFRRLHGAKTSSIPFEEKCHDYIKLLLDLYSKAVSVPDGDKRLAALNKEFGDLHVDYGEIPNFAPVPPDNMIGHQQWNYCPKSLANASYLSKEERENHIRVSREAACLRTYNRMLPDSATAENKVTPEEGYETISRLT